MATYIGFSTQFSCPPISSEEGLSGVGTGNVTSGYVSTFTTISPRNSNLTTGTTTGTMATGISTGTYSITKSSRPKTTDARPGYAGAPGTILQPVVPGKKFRIVDEKLVLLDLINALNIREGEKVGNPGYGCRIWNIVFEPNDLESRKLLETEIRRVASQDKRIIINNTTTYYAQNGILVELEISVTPFNNVFNSRIAFDVEDGRATFASLA